VTDPRTPDPQNERLVLLLAQHLASGSIEPDQALPALRELLGQEPGSLLELQTALAEAELTQAAPLQEAIQDQLCEAAREAEEAAPTGFPEDLPRGWVERAGQEPVTRDLIAKTRQRAYLGLEGEQGAVGDKVRARFAELQAQLESFPHPWSQLGLSAEDVSAPARSAWEARLAFEREQALSGQVPTSLLNEEAFLGALCESFSASADRAFQASILDRLLGWPTPVVAPFLWRICDSEWTQARACALLSFRFQEPQWSTWESVSAWLQWTQNQTATRPERGATFANAAPELSFVWYSQTSEADPQVLGQLVSELSERVAGVERRRLFAAHQVELNRAERALLAAPAGRLVTIEAPVAPVEPTAEAPEQPVAEPAAGAEAGLAAAAVAAGALVPTESESPDVAEPSEAAPEPVAAREGTSPGEEVPFDSAWLEANASAAGATSPPAAASEPVTASSGIPLDPALLRAALPSDAQSEHEQGHAAPAPFEWRPSPEVQGGQQVDPLAAPAEPRFRREPVPATPSVWEEHLRPLLAENWYMVVGLAMVLVGASLLAVYTWDRSPLLRYSLVPSLLALFTLGLGEIGFRLGKREVLRGTGLLLAGAAVALIPLNFVIVDLAAAEERLPARWLIALVLALIYTLVFSLCLRRWSKAAHEDLALRLVLPLIALNVLSAGLPLVIQAAAPARGAWILAAGAYVGLGVLSWGVLGVCRLLTKELLQERTTYLFAGAALFMTYLQGLLWSHVGAGTFPVLTAYPLLIVLAGGLVLRVERAFLRVADEHGHRAESFLGFGLILLGVVAGFASPVLRVVCLFVAGVIWLIQATRRDGVMHHFIGVLLLVGGACAIGVYDWFPRGGEEVNGLPFLGLSILVALGILRAGARSFENEGLATAAMEIQPFVLALTGVVSVLSQWHYRSEPLGTALVLAICGAVFFVRAIREERLDWVHSGALLFAVCLPYVGCADMVERTLPSNAMVFGLGVLAWAWIGALALTKQALLLKARSTVLTLYGSLAIAAMILRIFVDGGPSAEVSDLRVTLDLIGPLLLTGGLAVATYCARSLLPALLGAVVMAVLFPELKAEVKRLLPFVTWGSGLGSAVSGAVLILACYFLSRVERFRDLGQGDLIMDQVEFPLQRRDASLFTIPLGIMALILATKGLLQHLPRNYTSKGLPLKTAIALLIHGFTWSGLTALWRRLGLSRLTIHLAWVSVSLGIVFGYKHYALAQGLTLRIEVPTLAWLLTLSLWTLGLELLARRVEWTKDALLVPIRAVARAGTWLLGLGLPIALLAPGGRGMPLAAVTLAALAWHALASKHLRYGIVAFWLSLPVVVLIGHPALSLEAQAVQATSWIRLVLLCLGVQTLMLTLEFRRPDYQRFRGLLAPFHQGTSLLTLALAGVLGLELVAGHAASYSRYEQGAVLLVLGLVARGQRSGLVAFGWCVLAYLIAHGSTLAPLELQARLRLLGTPLSLTAWAAVIALAGALLRPAHEARPRRFLGSFPALGTQLAPLAELYLPVLAVTLVALAVHAVEFRRVQVQLLAPYLAAASVLLMGRDFLRGPLRILGGLVLASANVHAVNVLVVIPFLAAGGLSPTHVVCMGLILTLLQGSIVRRVVPREGVRKFVLVGNVALAGAVLLLLAVHYVSHANLAEITYTRFIVSGLLAYAAGLYFRQAARNPQPPFQDRGYQLEGCYHFGISLALWCLALLIPALRHPSTALIALGIAPLYFYLRAEYGEREGDRLGPIAIRYRDSAVVLCFFLVALYAAQGVFHLILFPSETPDFVTYHAGAPVLLVVSLVLLRLRGLGASDWLSFYGALGLVVSTYFCASAIPGASPFDHPVVGAWIALAVSHVFVVVTGGPSPLRTFLQWISGLDGTTWHAQRRSVGMVTLVTTCIVMALGAWRAEAPQQVAPLVFGLATIFIHHGAVTGLAWQRSVAFLLTLGALHGDFFLPSYIPQESVRWIVIAAWACAGLGYGGLRKIESPTRLANAFMLLAATSVGHAIYFHPESLESLLLAGAFLTLAIVTPAERHLATRSRDVITSSLLLLGLPWVAYWSHTDLRAGGAFYDAWPLAWLAAAVLAQGIFVLRASAPLADRLSDLRLEQPRVVHLCADFWSAQRWKIFAASLPAATGLMLLASAEHWGRPYALQTLALTSVVWGALAACWYRLGQARENLAWVLVAEACGVALLLGIRQHLLLGTEFWTLEYDVWASLALTAILAGLKEVTESSKRHNRLALVGTMLLLPLLAIAWAVFNELSSDITIVVVGVNSVILSVMGRSERKSPYNLLAVLGFVSFVILVVYSKLGLRSIQAYVIPVGLGIFVLLRLFGGELQREARRKVESVTLFAMIGSSAYYALADLSHPIGFNLTLLAVCFGGMLLGTILRVRLYLGIGGGGILLCLASIAFKVVMGLGRTVQVSALGLLLLLAGVALVGGSAYYKANREQVLAKWEDFLGRFEGWE
jgi:hypothetical protein